MSNFERDNQTGRYDYSDTSLICICGHTLGVHAGDRGESNKRPCFRDDLHNVEDVPREDCDCDNFRPTTTLNDNSRGEEVDEHNNRNYSYV